MKKILYLWILFILIIFMIPYNIYGEFESKDGSEVSGVFAYDLDHNGVVDGVDDLGGITLCKSFTIYNAVTSDDFLIWKTPVAITITDIHGVLQSGTNVVGGLDECDSDGANPVAVDADITFDGGSDEDDGSLTNGGIDAGDWIKWHTTSVSSPGYLTVTIYYTID